VALFFPAQGVCAVVDAGGLAACAFAFVQLVMLALCVRSARIRRRRAGKASGPHELLALAALGGAVVFAYAAGYGLWPQPLWASLFVVCMALAPAILASASFSGAGKSSAVTTNRVLRLAAKSLEDGNKQLGEMAARLEYERNRLQQRRVELEKENAQAEERIKQLCETADAFFTLGQSIDYARRIQQALIPSENMLRQLAGECFVLNMPRDKVSGDFLWCSQFDDGWTLVCVADCTGHGVPGAFMSALGTMLLGHIVRERGVRKPEQVLFAMDKSLRGALSSNGGDIQDGMEAAVILISPARNQAVFAGARLGLLRCANGAGDYVEPVRRAIGGRLKDNAPSFESRTLTLRRGEMLYLYSDGFQDQLGGSNSRRFLSGRFRDTLSWVAALPVPDQRDALVKAHAQWRKDRDQTDDILVVGLRV
jgi:serine phosphatase RsbU (regulator of sigma subunit)